MGVMRKLVLEFHPKGLLVTGDTLEADREVFIAQGGRWEPMLDGWIFPERRGKTRLLEAVWSSSYAPGAVEDRAQAALTLLPCEKGLLVRGDTFPVKDFLRELGGTWQAKLKGWAFEVRTKPALLAVLRASADVSGVEDKTVAPGDDAILISDSDVDATPPQRPTRLRRVQDSVVKHDAPGLRRRSLRTGRGRFRLARRERVEVGAGPATPEEAPKLSEAPDTAQVSKGVGQDVNSAELEAEMEEAQEMDAEEKKEDKQEATVEQDPPAPIRRRWALNGSVVAPAAQEKGAVHGIRSGNLLAPATVGRSSSSEAGSGITAIPGRRSSTHAMAPAPVASMEAASSSRALTLTASRSSRTEDAAQLAVISSGSEAQSQAGQALGLEELNDVPVGTTTSGAVVFAETQHCVGQEASCLPCAPSTGKESPVRVGKSIGRSTTEGDGCELPTGVALPPETEEGCLATGLALSASHETLAIADQYMLLQDGDPVNFNVTLKSEDTNLDIYHLTDRCGLLPSSTNTTCQQEEFSNNNIDLAAADVDVIASEVPAASSHDEEESATMAKVVTRRKRAAEAAAIRRARLAALRQGGDAAAMAVARWRREKGIGAPREDLDHRHPVRKGPTASAKIAGRRRRAAEASALVGDAAKRRKIRAAVESATTKRAQVK